MEHDPKYCDVIVQRCSKGHFETLSKQPHGMSLF
jgi:hypothetical protein